MKSDNIKSDLSEKFKKYNWKVENLNNKVKSLKTETYNFTNSKESNSCLLRQKNIEYFNRRGNLIKSTTYDNENNLSFVLEVSFDSKDFVTRFNYYNNDNSFLASCKFKHFKNGETVEEWIESYTAVTRYNTKDNSINKYLYFDDGSLIHKETYSYFFSENSIEWVLLDGFHRIKIVTFTDTFGNVKEENKFFDDDTITRKTNYEYRFDRHQNWIEKTEFLVDKNTQIKLKIYKRDIIYYQ